MRTTFGLVLLGFCRAPAVVGYRLIARAARQGPRADLFGAPEPTPEPAVEPA